MNISNQHTVRGGTQGAAKLQLVHSRPDVPAPSPKIRREAYSLYRAGKTMGQVARNLGIPYNETADHVFAEQAIVNEQGRREAFAAGRRSLLNPPPAARRAA